MVVVTHLDNDILLEVQVAVQGLGRLAGAGVVDSERTVRFRGPQPARHSSRARLDAAPDRNVTQHKGGAPGLQGRHQGSADCRIGVLPGGLALVEGQADGALEVAARVGWQGFAQLRHPAQQAEHGTAHRESVHPKVDDNALASGTVQLAAGTG
jgi:hypothetical protein